MNTNILLDTDSYKVSHFNQYPPNTTKLFHYLESRGGLYSNTVFFGLQYLLKKYFANPITMDDVSEANEFFLKHVGVFNKEGFEYLVDKHGGYFPIEIKAVAEGSVIPTHNVLMTVETTDPKCFWIASYLETMLMRLWYPITVATTSWYCKQIIKEYMTKSCETLDGISFKLHDFGSRGVSSKESAEIGGAAHLINFMGSDTVPGIKMLNEYYNSEMSGYSIPAMEHSTVTSWTKDREFDAYKNMLDQYSGRLIAAVSDSYDLMNVIQNMWGDKLKKQIIDTNTQLVIRPDSGDPVEIIYSSLIELDRAFGSTYNSKGYKVLNNVKLIQGDGITIDTLRLILKRVVESGYSIDNIAFGMGGGLLQKCDRDTQKFAYKCSWGLIDGKPTDIFKDPITDKGKASKAGKLDLVRDNNGFKTIKGTAPFGSLLQTYYDNGEILVNDSLDNIRERTAI